MALPTKKKEMSADDEFIRDVMSDGSSKKKIWMLFAGIVLLIALIVGIAFLALPKSGQEVGDSQSGVHQTTDGANNGSLNNSNKTDQVDLGEHDPEDMERATGFWMDNPYPIKKPEWLSKSLYALEMEMNHEEFAQFKSEVAKTFLTIDGYASDLNALPSRETGFVDDMDKALDENGNLNPMFSYWTAEGFNETVGFALEQFVNPEFGRWADYQNANNDNNNVNNNDNFIYTFKGLFDPKYIEEMKDTKPSEWIPVYADWNNNNYGMADQLIEDGTRWMGTVDTTDVELSYNEATQRHTAKVTAKVTYSAWSNNQQKLTKNGTITFNVVSGDDPTHRYLVRDTKLEIDG